MFENDYIMRMILQLARILRRSLTKQYPTKSNEVSDIEGSLAEAVDLDPRLMYSLDPQSLVSVLQLGSVDPLLAGYVVRSLYYVSDLIEAAGDLGKAELRRQQGDAIAAAYGIDVQILDDDAAAELQEFLDAQEAEQLGNH